MRVQKESKVGFALAVLSIFVVFSLFCFNEEMPLVADNVFLHNRAWQIRDCLRHGVYPFLYYEDCGGIGYGSPIFYGQLSLFPFLLFLDDISSFLKLYYLSCLLLNFFGFRCFLKRISEYATLVSCFYVTSLSFLCLFNANIPANVMAVGLSWFFFAFCIDFFRDGKNFFLVILSFFMIWQTNFNATVLSALVCFGIFLVYVDVRRWKDYVRLFLCVLLLVSYNIVNMYVHRDALRLTDATAMLSVLSETGDARVMSPYPFGGLLFRFWWTEMNRSCGFMSFYLLAVFLFFAISYFRFESKRFKVCSVVIIVLSAIGYFIGVAQVWRVVYPATNVFFQFPIRYFIYLFGFTLAILSRIIKPRWFVYVAVLASVVEIFLVNPYHPTTTSFKEDVSYPMGNGEYASEKFLTYSDVYHKYGFNVISRSGLDYEFSRPYGEVVVDCSLNDGDDEAFFLPKLYYLGYEAVGDTGEKFEVTSGYSNYCKVEIGDFRGQLTLRYRPPVVVLLLFFVQIACAIVYLVGAFRCSSYWNIFLKKARKLSKRS